MSQNQVHINKPISKKNIKPSVEIYDVVQKRFNIVSNKIQYCVLSQKGKQRWLSADQTNDKYKKQKNQYDKFIKDNYLLKQPNQELDQNFIYFCRVENGVLQQSVSKSLNNNTQQKKHSQLDSNGSNLQMSQLCVDNKPNQDSINRSNDRLSSKRATSSIKKSLFKEVNSELANSVVLEQNQSVAQDEMIDKSQIMGEQDDQVDRFKTESKKSQVVDGSEQKVYRSPLDKISGFLAKVVNSVSKKKDNSIF